MEDYCITTMSVCQTFLCYIYSMIVAIAIFAVSLTAQPAKTSNKNGIAKSSSAQTTANSQNPTKLPKPAETPAPATVIGKPSSQTGESNANAAVQNVKGATLDRIFTGVLAGVGALQLVVMFLTLLIYRRQAREMGRQRDEMRRQRHIMLRQWKAMQEQLGLMATAGKQTDELISTMRDTEVRELRAYVCVSKAQIVFRRERAPEIEVWFKNFGKTPAYDVRIWIGAGLGSYPLPVELAPPPKGFRMSRSVLPPMGKPYIMVYRHREIDEDAMKILGTPMLTMYIYGQILYRDVFGQERITNYRLIHGGPEGVRLKDKDGMAVALLKNDTEGNDGT